MNPDIILVKNKSNIIEDKTSETESYTYSNVGYKIKFKNGYKSYNYHSNQVFACSLRQEFDIREDQIVLINNEAYSTSSLKVLWDIDKLETVIFFNNGFKNFLFHNHLPNFLNAKKLIDDSQKFIVRKKDGRIFNNIGKIFVFDGYYKILYNSGISRIYSSDDLEVSFLYNNIGPLEYFKEITKELISPNNELSTFLYKQYMDMYVDDKSIFYNFLKEPSIVTNPDIPPIIFPFNFNLSQIDATKMGLTSNVSVIEGPPGTGKTETILNILMNLIMQNKTVAVVSGNNYAVENISTKLKEYNLDFLTALLGKTDNRVDFFDTPHPIPDLSFYRLDSDTVNELQSQVTNNLSQLDRLLKLNNELAVTRLELANLENEYFYFEDNFKNSKIKPLDFSNLSINQLSNLIVETYTIPRKDKISFLNKLKLFFKYRFTYFKELVGEPDKIQINLQRYLYINKKEKLKRDILKIEHELEDKNFDALNKSIKDDSMKLLKNFLFNHYNQNFIKSFNNEFGKDGYYLNNFQDFIKKHPIILSTVHSLKGCSEKGFLYDYIIIDEASQTDLVAAGVALSCAKNVIVVGDLKQLSHIVPENIKKKIEHLSDAYKINFCYDYIDNNILSCIKNLYKDIEPTLLREHYRCHPKIIEFCNSFFYENKLIVHTSGNTTDEPLILIESSKGSHSREDEDKKLLNLREIEECIRYQPRINQENFPNKDIGFIAPFNAQVNLANEHLEKDIFKSTINKFQGQECKIIIFSTVLDSSSRSNDKRVKFVNDNSLVNVAVSRAKNRFVLISNTKSFKPGSTIAELTNYMQYNSISKSIIQSDVYSIFDLMYSEYSDKLLNICVKNIKKVSDYPSENLANYVIEDVLSDSKYNFLDFTFNINLKKLIKNWDLLTDEEKHFVYNTSSEVDFVIYNKNNHMPVLVVEVDGYAFHYKKTDKYRDEIKNNILNKYNIYFLRLPTNSSNERNKLIDTLDKIIESNDKVKETF